MIFRETGEACSDATVDVLLIEDCPEDALLLERLLSKDREAFVLHIESSMQAAIERLKSGSIQLVLTDLRLPDSHDFQTLSAVQAAAPDVPIIVLSGLSDEDVACKMVEMGAEDYLVKGRIDRDSLVRAMRYGIE